MKIVIIGAGTAAMIVADILSESHNFTLAGFVGTSDEQKKFNRSKIYNEIPFLGDHSILPSLKENGIAGFVVAIGDNSIREEIYYKALSCGMLPINAISKNAIINPSVQMGKGIIVAPGAILSHGVILDDNIIIDPSVTIDINSHISSNCYIRSGAVICGECKIGKNVSIGVRAVVEPYLTVGKNQTVISGQIVLDNLDELYRKS